MNNITTAIFDTGTKYINVVGLWQYDYGQILRIAGLNMPKTVEIHFSLNETHGSSVTRIGITKDRITDVSIPDSMLENENAKEGFSQSIKVKTCTATFDERGDILYLVQNIYGKLQKAVNRLLKNCISISSLRPCRE